MSLNSSQRKFDKNKDGRLSSSEWTAWYFHEYGMDIENEERREKRALEKKISAWLFAVGNQLCDSYNAVLNSACALAPQNHEIRSLAQKAVMCEIVCGLLNSGNWNYSMSCGGTCMPPCTYYPYRQLIRFLQELVHVPWMFAEVEQAALKKKPLYWKEGALSYGECGGFWQQLIDVLPLFEECEGWPEELLEIFEQCAICYSQLSDYDYRKAKMQRWECFEEHWRVQSAPRFAKLLEQRAYFPDRAAAEDAVRRWDFSEREWACRELLAVNFPEAVRLWPPEELAYLDENDVIWGVGEKDPRLAIQMVKLLLNTAQEHLQNPDAAERLMGWGLDSLCSDSHTQMIVLDELKADENFARQLFQSAYVGSPQEELIHACVYYDQLHLRDRLLKLLEDNPYPHDPITIWPEEYENEPDEPLIDDGTVYNYCFVQFEGVQRAYAYRFEGMHLSKGDWVEAPLGIEDKLRLGQVQSTVQCTASHAPWPPNKTKMILRKVESPP